MSNVDVDGLSAVVVDKTNPRKEKTYLVRGKLALECFMKHSGPQMKETEVKALMLRLKAAGCPPCPDWLDRKGIVLMWD